MFLSIHSIDSSINQNGMDVTDGRMDGKGNALSIFFVGNLSFFTILTTSDHSEDAG